MPILSRIYRYPDLLIFLWVLPLLVVGLFADQSLLTHDEGLYATRAKFMFDTGDWINPWDTPHHKTPGPYWLIAFFYQLFGVNEVAVRLSSLLLSCSCLFLIYYIAKNIFSERIALRSSFTLSLEFLWLRYSYLGNPDYVTITLFLIAVLCLVKYNKSSTSLTTKNKIIYSQSLYLFLLGACLPLMILCRGFLAGMLIISLLPYILISKRRFQYFSQSSIYIGFLVGFIPLGLWLYLMFQRYGLDGFDALLSLFFRLSQEQRRGNSYFYYVINTLGLCFPWIFFAIFGAVNYWKKGEQERFLLIGIPVSIFLMITLYQTRLSHYALPLYPFFAVLAAWGIHAFVEVWQKRRSPQLVVKIISSVLGFLGILMVLLNIVAMLPESWLFFELDSLEYSYIVLPLGCAWILLGLFAFREKTYQKWVASLFLGHWLSFILLAASGLLTDVNPDLKVVVTKPEIQTVLRDHHVALFGGGKTRVLLNFYSPNINYDVKELDEVQVDDLVWIESELLAGSLIEYKIIGEYESWLFIQLQ